ncbi:hypothetical protein HNV11_09255 [Spirosoma taeanense]|uniref:Uncharacterized protein n=1 Tax=Spirosoma taeanense TaxID=2735870 RepID=A0A6M5Y8P4_9BACT|nr:hypothetical protein [Spirosoma taeanense]QJW89553.1 hypothetical protein HNV11_09255 [Spirosoma taeanense]
MNPIRYYAFDSLRATMMLLGLVLHASGPYIHNPYVPDDPQTALLWFD